MNFERMWREAVVVYLVYYLIILLDILKKIHNLNHDNAFSGVDSNPEPTG
jgi:hypothetical protein